MREIKFRAWDKLAKEMRYSEFKRHHYALNTQTDRVECSFVGMVHSKHFDLMQYTGLKDKNGKEIYEGDILYVGSKILHDDMVRKEVLVGFKDGAFMYGRGLDPTHMNTYIWTALGLKETEIIGNIYENPEIIKGV